MTESKARIPLMLLPRCPVQPDFIHQLNMTAGPAPIVSLVADLRLTRLLTETPSKGGDSRVSYEQAESASIEERSERHRVTRLPWVNPFEAREAWRDEQGSAAISIWLVCASCIVPGFQDKFIPLMNTSEFPPVASGGRNIWEIHWRRWATLHSRMFNQESGRCEQALLPDL